MTQPANDRPPRTPITKSGNYRLKVIPPRVDWIRHDPQTGVIETSLLLVDAEGNELKRRVTNKWGDWKSLAFLVGKFSGKFTAELRLDATPMEFLEYIKPACGHTVEVAVNVEPDMRDGVHYHYKDKPQYKYKLEFARGTIRPTPAPDSNMEAPPF